MAAAEPDDRPRRRCAAVPPPQENEVDSSLLELMKSGGYFYKHDFGRAKRSPEILVYIYISSYVLLARRLSSEAFKSSAVVRGCRRARRGSEVVAIYNTWCETPI